MTFGIKRLAIPEEEIREYLTFNLRGRPLSNCNTTTGRTRCPLQMNPQPEFQRDRQAEDMLQRWLLSDDHLRLSIGILRG